MHTYILFMIAGIYKFTHPFPFIRTRIFIQISIILDRFGESILVILGDLGASGVTLAKNMKKMCLPRNLLEAIWVPRCAKLEQRSRQVGKLGAKMCPTWPTWRLRWRTWRQDVPNMANLEAKMANLAHFWEPLDHFFWILGAILSKIAKIKKTTTVHHF